ncbi:MAG: S9 family peptidase [Vicinamibacteria bacterium]|nr:S9 family peptidase [Vicinamibacteria bacterium]
MKPPQAATIPRTITLHGETLEDPYFWLREKENPAVRAYLEAENEYADWVTAPLADLSSSLYDEMLARIQEDDTSAPYRFRGYEHWVQTVKGLQYPIHHRRRLNDQNAAAPAETTLDVNALAEGRSFMSLGAYAMSDDGRFLAYSTDDTGFRQYRLQVKDLRTGALWARAFEKTVSVAWAADSNTLFFTEEDHAKRAARLYRIAVFSNEEPALAFEEDDERFNLDILRSRSGAFLFLVTGSHTTAEIHLLDAGTPQAAWTLVSRRRQDHEYDLDHQGDRFLIRTNDRGRNFRLVEAPVEAPGEENWRELVPHREDVMLESVIALEHHAVLGERSGGLPRFRSLRLDLSPGLEGRFEEPTYSAFPRDNHDYTATVFRYAYQSLVTPPSVFDLDLITGRSTLVKQTEVIGSFSRGDYISEWTSARTEDGVQIPISLVRRRDTPVDGTAPMYLLGYGSYGYPYPVSFVSPRLSLIDRGFVIALAHIRGGGEMGKAWHDAGRMATKMNTFTDFIACATSLIDRGYTSRPRLVIEGGSAGGLLMGGVTNLRPDLMKAVIAKVPFVDVLNSMLDEDLPLTVAEFEEWGNPKVLADYRVMRAYCPYSNLEKRPYPAILLRNSFNDSQVMYWEAAKYAARLRTLKTTDAPLLLRTLMDAGHGGASGRYDALRETASDYAFILWQVGAAVAPENPDRVNIIAGDP